MDWLSARLRKAADTLRRRFGKEAEEVISDFLDSLESELAADRDD